MIEKLLLFSGVHGSRNALAWLPRVVASRKPDALLFAGGILPDCRPLAGKPTTWSFTLPEAEFVEEFFAMLGGLKVFSAVIPGPAGKPRKALLLPAPPPGALGGVEGVPLIGDLIDSYHPDLCVVAGSSERRGSQRVGRTLVVNPGRLADGSAAWLDWGRAGAAQVEFVNLRGLASDDAARSLQDGSGARRSVLGAVVPAQPMSLNVLKRLASMDSLLWTAAPAQPRSQEETRLRAYLLWEAACKPAGNDGTFFWRQAEKELASRWDCNHD